MHTQRHAHTSLCTHIIVRIIVHIIVHTQRIHRCKNIYSITPEVREWAFDYHCANALPDHFFLFNGCCRFPTIVRETHHANAQAITQSHTHTHTITHNHTQSHTITHNHIQSHTITHNHTHLTYRTHSTIHPRTRRHRRIRSKSAIGML